MSIGVGRSAWTDEASHVPRTERSSRPGPRPSTPLLIEARPDLVAQWHPERNLGLSVGTVTCGTSRRVWWRCPEGPDHEWQTSVANRARPQRGSTGNGCPFCVGKRASVTNSLRTLHPELSDQWDPKRNGELTPDDVVPGSNKTVHWCCPEGHRWTQSVIKRALRGFGCPYCGRKRITLATSLRATHPDVAAQWAADLNVPLVPDQVFSGSSVKVWWRCAQGHTWKTSIAMRTGREGTGCPYCPRGTRGPYRVTPATSLAAVHPDIAAWWDNDLNGALSPHDVRSGSEKIVAWRCPAAPDHVWHEQVARRISNQACPFCTGRRPSSTSSLAATHPELASQWHIQRNGPRTPCEVTKRSMAKAWWQCPLDPAHAWQAIIRNRAVLGNGCPYCSGFYASPGHSVAAKHPDAARLWHPTRNGDLTPDQVTPAAKQKVWWKCQKGADHEWQREVYQTTAGVGCPFCANRRVSAANNLATTHPRLAAEWHSTKNGTRIPAETVYGSTYRAWWRCTTDPLHEWQTTVVARTHNGTNCPYCTLAPRSLQEILLAFEIREFLPLDPDVHKITVTTVAGETRILDVDIVLPDHRLAIEFDGSYWHQGKEAKDEAKAGLLRGDGWTVIRVREAPLRLLHSHDVEVPALSPKRAADAVLQRLELLLQRDLGLREYLRAKQPRAESKARRHALHLTRERPR
ncbi:zinc-ribbon domain-containing protein [Kitasatospora sp. NPDC091257]|uniref:zinc-ribbon domain-containing protein n=1 Tax=Kitasatospora sp. NPDC091257 TaxID=3364084 RepID=UPI00381EEADE